MGMPTSEALPVARSGEPRTRTALLLESIAPRHQIAVLQRSRTCVWRTTDFPRISNSPHTPLAMVAEVVLSVMGNRSDRRFLNLSCARALEAVWLTRRRRADFHQGRERKIQLRKQAEHMAATGFTLHPTIAFRSGLGPCKAQRSPSFLVGVRAGVTGLAL